MADQLVPAAEFQSLPLESIIAAPLKAAIQAQIIAAETTRSFIESMLDKDGKPINVKFLVERNVETGQNPTKASVAINTPLLSMVPIPHLQINSITTHFRYEVSDIRKEEKQKEGTVGGTAGTTGLLSKFVNISLNGSLSTKSREESQINRSGVLEVTVNASEAPIPEGLARILDILAKSVTIPGVAVAE